MQSDIKIQQPQTEQSAPQSVRGVLQPMHDTVQSDKPQVIDNPMQQFEFDNDATTGTPEPAFAPRKTHHGVTIGIAASLSILFISGTFAAYMLL